MKLKIAAALVAASFLVAPATAQEYPTQPLTMLVPFSAGGPTDVVARLVAQVMSRELGQQVLVENAAGAGGTLASGRLAQAEPDGYTMLIHHLGIATSATLYRSLPYDPLTAFDYVGQVTTVPMLLVSRPDYPAENFEQLLQMARENPDETLLANAGPGAVSHICGMLFMQAIGEQLTTVPYPGTGPAMTDVMGGQVDLLCDQTTNAIPPVSNNSVKAYATATAERIPQLPDVPTALEQGLEGFEVGVWHGIYVPAGTPEDRIETLSSALQVALQDETVLARFNELGTAPVPLEDATRESLKNQYESQIEFWRPLIEQAGEYAN
ncbi:tripartite tricarboxylate transporter substrate-binding protein [Aureimonas mangrovi]|uniref:tripartite tricarboxylate transporter substrate-binding protein n=1 Tax=Aureimonas mangrovi TaxID=2758041 RepID=UPI00163D87A9|nr:tripartite tricarboxylate transporter substrate-binding protein [Aureimonas mangrovi]